ncbi:C6 zinc finger domain-containing protein [Plectosphaerella plurivora]|uniref:C6 zinc finger domain-containing protein n=1 Tax=Plectosphaerella plurivora TaxID=936078 RepID=A0A9P9A7A2_9PEZI|nr:C6 zinc finger domain-containing protein [Plectosphaerella plurivora]
MEDQSDQESQSKTRKRRIPKACGACRQSKVKCDGQRPCSRCRSLRKTCNFVERPKDENELKIELLEKKIASLTERLAASSANAPPFPQQQQFQTVLPITAPHSGSSTHTSPVNHIYPSVPRQQSSTAGSPVVSIQPPGAVAGRKRKRSHFEVGELSVPDFIDVGLITHDEATAYHAAFFSGCDRFVPVFDPQYDTLDSVRARNSLLFAAICSVGCRVVAGADSRQWHVLSFHTQRMLNAAITTPGQSSLETVQALLVRACYVTERSLLISIATRMAYELGLQEAYDTMSARCVSGGRAIPSAGGETVDDDATLMRRARTWLYLLVMGHILHVDAGGLPTFRFRGAARRCRILLESPLSTDMDLYLFSQVELNVLRLTIYDTLSKCATVDDEDMMDLVRDARIDIGVWFDDWSRIYERRGPRVPWLAPNLAVQRCWAESMALCRAVRASGVENVDAMSPSHRTILLMAKDALQQHLDIILAEPREYLAGLRYAMDFVWAKNAFCFLLLLKLSVLLPENGDQQSNRGLVEKGRILMAELHQANGGGSGNRSEGARTTASGLYLRLVKVSIEKYSQVLQGGAAPAITQPVGESNQQEASPGQRPGQNELESFVPEEFVFEWDFPGLTLFSSPITEAGWFDDFLAGALDMGDDVYGMGWASVDFSV